MHLLIVGNMVDILEACFIPWVFIHWPELLAF